MDRPIRTAMRTCVSHGDTKYGAVLASAEPLRYEIMQGSCDRGYIHEFDVVNFLEHISLRSKKTKLAQEVEELSGEKLFGCYQCGTCAAGCPFIEDMDLTPDEVIHQVTMNNPDVLGSKTIWLCSSCFTCAERCPRDINITKIMEALRQIILRQNIDECDPLDIPMDKLKKIPQIAFVSIFRKNTG